MKKKLNLIIFLMLLLVILSTLVFASSKNNIYDNMESKCKNTFIGEKDSANSKYNVMDAEKINYYKNKQLRQESKSMNHESIRAVLSCKKDNSCKNLERFYRTYGRMRKS